MPAPRIQQQLRTEERVQACSRGWGRRRAQRGSRGRRGCARLDCPRRMLDRAGRPWQAAHPVTVLEGEVQVQGLGHQLPLAVHKRAWRWWWQWVSAFLGEREGPACQATRPPPRLALWGRAAPHSRALCHAYCVVSNGRQWQSASCSGVPRSPGRTAAGWPQKHIFERNDARVVHAPQDADLRAGRMHGTQHGGRTVAAWRPHGACMAAAHGRRPRASAREWSRVVPPGERIAGPAPPQGRGKQRLWRTVLAPGALITVAQSRAAMQQRRSLPWHRSCAPPAARASRFQGSGGHPVCASAPPVVRDSGSVCAGGGALLWACARGPPHAPSAERGAHVTRPAAHLFAGLLVNRECDLREAALP